MNKLTIPVFVFGNWYLYKYKNPHKFQTDNEIYVINILIYVLFSNINAILPYCIQYSIHIFIKQNADKLYNNREIWWIMFYDVLLNRFLSSTYKCIFILMEVKQNNNKNKRHLKLLWSQTHIHNMIFLTRFQQLKCLIMKKKIMYGFYLTVYSS